MSLKPILPGGLVQVPPTISNPVNIKGSLDCSANPNYPSASSGDLYYVSVAGKVGGASGATVTVGDAVICLTTNAGGTQAGVGSSWFILEKNQPNFSDLNFSTPATANVTLSDPTKTLLIGASAIANLSSTIAGSQLLLSTRATDTNYPFAVVGDYRNGVSGERYYAVIAQDGHYTTNSYLTLIGIGYGKSEECMQAIWADVPICLSISNGLYNDSQGGKLINCYGMQTADGLWPVVFNVSSQGTTTISNPYGQTGTVQYNRPQIVLSDVGANSAAPSWTYASIRQKAGHLRIGTFDGTSTEGDELDVTTGAVTVNGALSQSLNQNASTAVTVTNTTSGASSESVFRAYSDSGRQTTIGTYSAGTTAYGAITSSSSYIYSNAPQMVVMSDVGPIIFATNGNSEHVRIGSGLMVGTTTEPNAGNVSMSGKVTTYNNIATEGNGLGAIVKATRVTAQSAANSSIAIYTTPAADGSYLVSGNINVTAAIAISTSLNCDYTDETNTARTMIIPISGLGGTFVTGGLATSTGPFESSVMHIRTKASTTIKIYTAAGTFTSATYNAEGVIRQLA